MTVTRAAQRGKPAGMVEHVFAASALFFLSDAIRPLLLNPKGEGTVAVVGDPLLVPGLIVVYGLSTVALGAQLRLAFGAVRSVPWLVAIVLISWLSVTWSTDATTTVKQAVWFSGATSFGIYLHVRFGVHGTLRLLATVLAIIMVLSVGFATIGARLGIDPSVHNGAWRGVFLHKNGFGRMMVLTTLVFATLARRDSKHFPLLATISLVATGMLVVSRSASAAVVLACMLPALLARNVISRIHMTAARRLSWTIAVAATGSLLVIRYSESLLGFLGKDTSFTGRTLLWAATTQEILSRPLLGFGFGAFWHGGTTEFARVWSIVGWAAPNAHNGFLDVLLQFGFVGGAIVILCILVLWSRALGLPLGQSAHRAWPFTYLTFMLLSNIAETAILQFHPFFWVLFCSAAVASAERGLPGSDTRSLAFA